MRKASLIRHSLNSKAEKRIKKSEKPGSKMKWRRLSIKKIRQWLAVNNGLNSDSWRFFPILKFLKNQTFFEWKYFKSFVSKSVIFQITRLPKSSAFRWWKPCFDTLSGRQDTST